jgi:hypothetical protein
MRVTDEIFSDGERRPIIVNDDATIDFWSTLYVTVELRADGKQNTIKKELYNISLLHKWERSTGRDLLDEFRRQKLLDKETIKSIKNFCRLSAKEHKRKSEKVVHFTRLAKTESPLRGTGDIPSAKDIILEIPFSSSPTERHQFLIDVSFC